MRPHPDLVDRLAAEYVLGTLRGLARRRFERWRERYQSVEARCRIWEERLLPLSGELRPVRPPAHVWAGIQAHLESGRPSVRARPPRRRRLLALAASFLVTAGAGTLLYWESPGSTLQQAAIPAPASGIVAWRIEVHSPWVGRTMLITRTDTLPQWREGRDYELWALPAGGKPVSLGVLPAMEGVTRHVLTEAQLAALKISPQVAVSVEPMGGSPTGQPTGAVVATAALSAPS